jgi:hypothetical protein
VVGVCLSLCACCVTTRDLCVLVSCLTEGVFMFVCCVTAGGLCVCFFVRQLGVCVCDLFDS